MVDALTFDMELAEAGETVELDMELAVMMVVQIDPSGFVTRDELDTTLEGYVSKEEFDDEQVVAWKEET